MPHSNVNGTGTGFQVHVVSQFGDACCSQGHRWRTRGFRGCAVNGRTPYLQRFHFVDVLRSWSGEQGERGDGPPCSCRVGERPRRGPDVVTRSILDCRTVRIGSGRTGPMAGPTVISVGKGLRVRRSILPGEYPIAETSCANRVSVLALRQWRSQISGTACPSSSRGRGTSLTRGLCETTVDWPARKKRGGRNVNSAQGSTGPRRCGRTDRQIRLRAWRA